MVEWNVFEDIACSIGFNLFSSQHQKGLRLHVHLCCFSMASHN